MKYEIIKKKVAQSVYTSIKHCQSDDCYAVLAANAVRVKPKRWRDSLQNQADFAYDTIMQWDIRSVTKLRSVFPQYFPKSLLEGKLTADYDDDSNWIVFIK